MREKPKWGTQVRALRRRENLTQAQLAERIGISTSYLNLIENNRRPLSAPLLIRLAQHFHMDLQSFAEEQDAHLLPHLSEAFGDPIFDGFGLGPGDIRELAGQHPAVSRAILTLYRSYKDASDAMNNLTAALSDQAGLKLIEQAPSEEVSDLIQRHRNYFPELEAGAERLRADANLDGDLYQGLVSYLDKRHGIEVRMERVGHMSRAVRRFDAHKRILYLSEVLRRGSRNFQLAHQVGLLTQAETLDRIAREGPLTNDDSRALCRVSLANYFAGAVLMPYQPFLDAARAERYDVELLGHRFRASFEQVCHRLTTLGKPGAEGVPFHLVRVDIAGNISKRFTASGMRFPRFNAACPLWNVHAAFLTPGMFRVQLQRLPDGQSFFSIARTLRKDTGGYHAPRHMQAVAVGCEVSYARELVYADGIDLDNLDAAVPVGITCRLCDRMDCEQRAVPPLQHPLTVRENVRGISFYTPVD